MFKSSKTVRILIAESHRLFPTWSASQRHSWVRAKLRLADRPPRVQIGTRNSPPAFLHVLPPGPPLALTVPLKERVLRLVKGG